MINFNAYLILDSQNVANWWSVSHSSAQAWEDFREWWRTKEEGIYQAAPEVSELQAQGYKCVQLGFIGIVQA